MSVDCEHVEVFDLVPEVLDIAKLAQPLLISAHYPVAFLLEISFRIVFIGVTTTQNRVDGILTKASACFFEVGSLLRGRQFLK